MSRRLLLHNCTILSPNTIEMYVSWFNRYLDGNANKKWVDEHLQQLIFLIEELPKLEQKELPSMCSNPDDGTKELEGIGFALKQTVNTVTASGVFNSWAKWNQTLNNRIKNTEQALGSILSVIHGDDGSYIANHGWDAALKDAHEKWGLLKSEEGKFRRLFNETCLDLDAQKEDKSNLAKRFKNACEENKALCKMNEEYSKEQSEFISQIEKLKDEHSEISTAQDSVILKQRAQLEVSIPMASVECMQKTMDQKDGDIEQLKKEVQYFKGVIQAQALIANSIVGVAEKNGINLSI